MAGAPNRSEGKIKEELCCIKYILQVTLARVRVRIGLVFIFAFLLLYLDEFLFLFWLKKGSDLCLLSTC